MFKFNVLSVYLLLVCISVSSFAQEIAIGEWRDHLPYGNGISVTSDDDYIWCATPYNLFSYNKEDFTLNRITSISGLSDIGISKTGYSHESSTLVIAYRNANIDLIKGNVIINMNDILESQAITPEEKTINNIMFRGKFAYLSCGFGVVVLNIEDEEVADTWYIGPDGSHLNVLELAYNDTSYIAATENGIYYADINSLNLAYFGSWSKDWSLPFPNAEYNHITIMHPRIFVNRYTDAWAQDTIYYFEDNHWKTDTSNFANDAVWGIKVFENKLYVIHRYFINIYDADLTLLNTIWNYNYTASSDPKDVIVDGSYIWIADNAIGLVKIDGSGHSTFIRPNGPKTADVYHISAAGNYVYAVPGGRDLSWNNIWKASNIFSFDNTQWSTVDKSTFPALDTIYDLVVTAGNPFKTNQVFVGSWWRGLIELTGGELTNLYTPSNSGLDYKNDQGSPVCKVGGLTFDPSGNLWVISSHANKVLSVRINDGSSLGQWHSFNLGSYSSQQDLGHIIIDSYNQKWIIGRSEHSLMVFNDNGTITNTGDDQVKVLSSSAGNGAIPGNKVYSIAPDKDGEIWLGTDAGIAVFYSPGNIFSNYNFDAQQILIPRNDGSGLADILFEFETITAIAVDGDNNKWIGTDRSGVFLMSSDGQEEIHHFTEDNSPLLSNNITSIAIDSDGEVFFATAEGIISYKGRARDKTIGGSTVYAYPNPVRPGYTGVIAIAGLPENATFKITDVSGSLIYSGRAEGTQAIWDGNNFEGRRAQSGVYFVFVADDDASETVVTKILMIN